MGIKNLTFFLKLEFLIPLAKQRIKVLIIRTPCWRTYPQ